jgi:hypothetical protein
VPRLRLDPTSPSGVSLAQILPPMVRQKANGYVVNKATGLITPGTNITITGNGTLESPYVINSSGGGSGITRVVAVTSGSFTAGTTANTDYVYLIAGAHPATLPAASSNNNRYTFKNNHIAAVAINRAGSDTVEGATSISVAPGDSVDLISNSTSAWSVI